MKKNCHQTFFAPFTSGSDQLNVPLHSKAYIEHHWTTISDSW